MEIVSHLWVKSTKKGIQRAYIRPIRLKRTRSGLLVPRRLRQHNMWTPRGLLDMFWLEPRAIIHHRWRYKPIRPQRRGDNMMMANIFSTTILVVVPTIVFKPQIIIDNPGIILGPVLRYIKVEMMRLWFSHVKNIYGGEVISMNNILGLKLTKARFLQQEH